MTAEKLDNISNGSVSIRKYNDCRYHYKNSCSKKLRIYYIVSDDYIFIDRICKKHLNMIMKKEQPYQEIIELSNKDILYLKITGKL